ncbi:hypothetical protein JZ751_008569, partial [Albula glossodonta]
MKFSTPALNSLLPPAQLCTVGRMKTGLPVRLQVVPQRLKPGLFHTLLRNGADINSIIWRPMNVREYQQ